MNIFKKVNWTHLIMFTVLLSVAATMAIAATEDNKLKFTVTTPIAGENIVKGKTKIIKWTVTGTEDNLNALIEQDRIARIYLMEKVYRTSGATTTKTTKLLADIDLDGQIECNDIGTVCSLVQSYNWAVSTKLKSNSKYFIRVYLRSRPNLMSGLAKFFTLNNRYVYNDSGVFTIKSVGENTTPNQKSTSAANCSPKLSYINEGDLNSKCCSGLKACRLAGGTKDICLSGCDANTVKEETMLLSSVIKVVGEVDSTVESSYPSSLVPQTTEGTFEHPAFQVSKNSDGTYHIHWFNGTFGASNVVTTFIKDATGKIVFNSNSVRIPDAGFGDFDVALDGKQKYTIVLDKVLGSQKNIEYTFDSSLINNGTKITNNVLNKAFDTSDSFFSFLNTAISADGKSFGIDFDLKDTYGYYASRPVNKITITLGDGTKKTIEVNDSFLSQQNKGIVLPLIGTDKNIQIDLYDAQGNKIETKTLSVASNQNITLATDYKGATGWKSVYDPAIRLSSTGVISNNSWKNYTINYDAVGASKIVLMDAKGNIIISTPNSSMTLSDKQLLAGNGYYLAFYDGSGKLAHTEYISLDAKGNYDNNSLTDPSIYFTTCGGGRYYIPFAVAGAKDFSFVGEGDAKSITFNNGDYIDGGLLKPGQIFDLTYTDPVDNKVHTYTVTVTSEKLSNGSYRLSYTETTNAVVTALDCGKQQGKSCLESDNCQKLSSVGQLNCDKGKVCCTDACVSPKVSCNGTCVDSTTFTTADNCGSCGKKCSATEKCEEDKKDGIYKCFTSTSCASPLVSCNGTCVNPNMFTAKDNCGSCDNKCGETEVCKLTNDTTYKCVADTAIVTPVPNNKCDGLCSADDCERLGMDRGTGSCSDSTPYCCKNFSVPKSVVDTCVGDKGACQSSGCNFATQSVGSGSCNSLEKPYCCKNVPTAPTEQSPNCYTGAFLCGKICCSIATETCEGGKCVTKSEGCTGCGTANCGECSSAVNGSRCICSGSKGGGYYTSCQGQSDNSCTIDKNPCDAGTLSCGSGATVECCTANQECVSGHCQLKEDGCTKCDTAPCGACSSMNNGYRCSCTGSKGNGFAVCSGGTEKDPTCPGYCAAGTTLCGTNCCTAGYKCVSNKCVTNSTPVPSANIISLFSSLKSLFNKWFK